MPESQSSLMTRLAERPAPMPRPEADFACGVVIAAHNAQATIVRAMQSALICREVTQLCVVDDASSDDTVALALEIAARDPRVRVIRLNVNVGPALARNRGIAELSAPWIAILDADDYILPDRFARLARVEHCLSKQGQAPDFLGDRLIRIPLGAPPNLPPDTPQDMADPHSGEAQQLSFADFALRNLGRPGRELDLGFLKPVIRRDFWQTAGLSYRADLRLGEDYELYARAILQGARFFLLPACGYVSIEREGSLSRQHAIKDLRALRDCDTDLADIRRLATSEKQALAAHRHGVNCRLQWRILIEAIKQGNVPGALATFSSPALAFYLIGQLIEAVAKRLARVWTKTTKPRACANGPTQMPPQIRREA